MNERQRQIFDWLKQVDPDLAGLYEGAVRIIEDKTFSGRERFICYAVREIRNRLPDAVAGEYIIRRLDYTKQVEELAQIWELNRLESAYEKQDAEKDKDPVYKISRETLVKVNQLVREHKEVKTIKEDKAKRLFIALEPDNEDLKGSLEPVAKLWVDETEWFVERVHVGDVGKETSEDDLISHFKTFESVLVNLVGFFYEGFERIEQIVETANESGAQPKDTDVTQAISLLGRAIYRKYFFEKLMNEHWIEPLQNAGCFSVPPDAKEGEAYESWPQRWYIKNVSSKSPEKVFEILSKITCKNPYVRSGCIKCLLEMPIKAAAKGSNIVENILPTATKDGDLGWLWIGEDCAELMVKLIRQYPKEAFKIAWVLLEAWVSKDKTIHGDEIIAKFSEHHYKELMLEYYDKVWEAQPRQAIWILVKILDRCLDVLDKGKEDDASKYFGYGLELGDLNEIDMKHPGIKTVLVKGICEAGKVLIDKEPGKVSELLDLLEGTKRVIFVRIAMYLLRFVKTGTEKERISKFVGNKEYFEAYKLFWNEHKRLLNDKFDDVSEDAKKAFLEWVDEDKYSKDEREEIIQEYKNNKEAEPNFEKWENFAKAEQLYPVQERFKGQYERYKKAAGVKNDSELAPRKMIGEARFVSPEEGSPYSSEKMGKDNVENVIDYLLEPKNYEGKEKVSGWGTAEYALAESLKADVKKRPIEYLKVDLKKLESLDPEFLGRLFYGISESARDGSFKNEGWERLIDLVCGIVGTKSKEKEWRDCFLAILWVLHDGFGDESNRITFNETIIRKLWLILKELVDYSYDENLESEEDPIQRQLRSVQGSAFERVVLLGIVCKKDFASVFEDFLKKEMTQVYTLVAKEIKRSEVNCTFGARFVNIYWLDKEWVESNTEIIFDDKMWDAVWGAYVSWGMPSRECFKFLDEKGKYSRAVERIETKNKYKFGKDPNKGLVEQLMIGYFNGWVTYEELASMKFFEAPAELRGYAAQFLTTRFKFVNEEGGTKKAEVARRMKEYWEKRLSVLRLINPKENAKEAIEFTGWVEESILPAEETLKLLELSLDLSGGQIGEMGDARDFVEGICKLGKGNELLALQCLKKAAADKNIHTTWSSIQDPIVKFLEDLPESVWSEGREVADLYGRYNPDKFRGVWEKLKAG